MWKYFDILIINNLGKNYDEIIPKIIKVKDVNPPICEIALWKVNVYISNTCIWLDYILTVSFIWYKLFVLLRIFLKLP